MPRHTGRGCIVSILDVLETLDADLASQHLLFPHQSSMSHKLALDSSLVKRYGIPGIQARTGNKKHSGELDSSRGWGHRRSYRYDGPHVKMDEVP